MQIGDSYLMEDKNGKSILILKDSLDEQLVAAMKVQKTTRIVVRIYRTWGSVALRSLVNQVREFWIEDDEAPNEIASVFDNVISLHLKRPPAKGFLATFHQLEECRLDGLAFLPPEIKALGRLKSLTLGDRCRLNEKSDFSVLAELRKLVLSGSALPKNFVAFGSLANLRFLGMSQWPGASLEFFGGLTELCESTLMYFPKVTSLEGLENAASIERLHLAAWAKLEDLEQLVYLKKLKSLIIEDCPKITSLEPLVEHPALESVSLWGRTNVKDGRLKRLKEGKTGRRELRFNNRSHYDLKSVE